MKRRVLAFTVIAWLLGVPPAWAQTCSAAAQPEPGWLGGPITVTGTGFAPNDQVFINLGGLQLSGGTPTDSAGAFTFVGSIPDHDFSTGDALLFVADFPANCESQSNYEVLASEPTPATTGATTATTSTAAATTTAATAAPSTTVASTTTTASATDDSADTSSPDTTVVAAPDSESDGTSPVLWVLFGALLGAFLVGVGMLLGRRSGSD